MKKRWTALLLALAMLSALAVGALADEQKKDETAAETAQTTPDAAGTLSFENLGARMRTGNYTLLSLEENVAAIECLDYDKMYEDLRNGLNSIASAQWGLIQMGQGESTPMRPLHSATTPCARPSTTSRRASSSRTTPTSSASSATRRLRFWRRVNRCMSAFSRSRTNPPR